MLNNEFFSSLLYTFIQKCNTIFFIIEENSYSTSVENDLVPVAPTLFEYII